MQKAKPRVGRAVVAVIAVATATARSQAPTMVDFGRDVQPLFRQHCIGCHGPSQQMQGLRLDRRRDAMAIGGSRVIVPGSSEESRLFLRVAGNQLGLQMPPAGALSVDQIDIIKKWIDQGAEWPEAFSGNVAPTRPDQGAVQIMEALRAGDRRAFEKRIHDDLQAINLRGAGGSTPLMYAALYGDVEAVQRLLDGGADPNVRNDAGATPLLWAVDDVSKVRVLLDHGADPNARSADGNTALTAAVLTPRAETVVELLLDRGAQLTEGSGSALLTHASRTGNEAVIRVLIDHGAKVESARLALAIALRAGCGRCFDLLLESAGQQDVNAALAEASQAGDLVTAKRLLDRGADVNAEIATVALRQSHFTVLMSAAFSEWAPADAVNLLIEHGGDVNRRASGNETALDFALRQGRTPVVDLLRRTATHPPDAPATKTPETKPAESVEAAMNRAIPLLQRSDVTFLRKAGCVSCHNNSLTAMTIASARKRQLKVDEQVARAQLQSIAAYIESWRERTLQGDSIPGQWNTVGYILTGMAAEHYPPDAATDALARFIKNSQLPDGHWWNFDGHLRPPIDSSDFQVTAMAIQALKAYAPRPRRAAYMKAVEGAATWLGTARPRTTEDRVFQILGLAWAGSPTAIARGAGRALLDQQGADGGWAQLPSLASDAYATGQALVALKEAGALRTDDPAYKRGVAFLMNSQLEDGSWYVKSRSLPLMPYFESDFPHGHNQFISAAATNWAALALTAR
jgi:ankyrin repeat protein